MFSLAAPHLPASRPKSADVVLYLDLDGVVHHEAVYWSPSLGIHMGPETPTGRRLFEWTPILEEALEPYPSVALVLSSSWCVRPGYSRTLKRFPTSLRGRFIGGTFHKRIHGADPWTLQAFRQEARGMQVWADVQRRKPRRWLALDDEVFGWPAWARENLIACDGATGLSAQRVQDELVSKLAACHELAA